MKRLTSTKWLAWLAAPSAVTAGAALLLGLGVAAPPPAAAQSAAGVPLAGVPAAVVEDVKGKVSGLEFMDYVEAGRVIKLGTKDTVVLGYLKSCWRETITGGTVVVGTESSLVHLGTIDRVKVACDPAATLGSRQATESAATVFRGMAPGQAPGAEGPQPPVLYGLSPVFEVKEPDTLVIERTDKVGERRAIALRGKTLVRGRFYDLAKSDTALAAGGTYVASLGGRKVAFRIAPDARAGATPAIGRLVRFD
ncbi:hypothetical protein [Rhodoplanes serenus]|uniref:hypothetical protein n=1 Tax=Rhodoplanes serenus TaxID=200615 RepID=UPI002545F97C|nr:hypothetical protein [Rhodoplanes serenus]